MSSLNEIEEFLNIEIGDKRLRNGKKKMNKNTYYWYRNEYYIVNLSNDKWCIMSTGEQTRELLTNHIYCFNRTGYAMTNYERKTALMHRMLMNPPRNMCIDHINRHTFDNRLENLRIVTNQENNRNASKRHDNTSGIAGVSKIRNGWIARICDNNNKQISKSFTVNKNRNDGQCKQLAVNQRRLWVEQLGYLGE